VAVNTLRVYNDDLHDLQLQAILDKIYDPIVTEAINAEFTFSFRAPVDETEKWKQITHTHIVEADGQYFDIVKYHRRRESGGEATIQAECEHVSYRLFEEKLVYYTADNELPADIVDYLLAGTGLVRGTVAYASPVTVSIQEATNRRNILVELAILLELELEFDGLTVNLVERRGADKALPIRLGLNLASLEYEVDDTERDEHGQPKITIGVSVVELASLEGYGDYWRVELGDGVHVIEPELDIDTTARIVKHTRDIQQDMVRSVEIANYYEGITDVLVRIERDTVIKDEIYNGVRIGPSFGFLAERSDLRARAIMNATRGFSLEIGDGLGGYDDAFYVEIVEDVARLFLKGAIEITGGNAATQTYVDGEVAGGVASANSYTDGEVTGLSNSLGDMAWENLVEAAKLGTTIISGGYIISDLLTANNILAGAMGAERISASSTLTVGTGNNVAKMSGAGTDRIWAGHDAAASAPFRVSQAGALTATSGAIGGWAIDGSSGLKLGTTSNTRGIATGTVAFYAGHATPGSAPFRVTTAGVLTATSATIEGSVTATSGAIGGFTLSGSALYAGSGSTRVQMDTGSGIWLGATAFADAPFRVNRAGKMVAEEGEFGGDLTAQNVVLKDPDAYFDSSSLNFETAAQPGSGDKSYGTIQCLDIDVSGNSYAGMVFYAGDTPGVGVGPSMKDLYAFIVNAERTEIRGGNLDMYQNNDIEFKSTGRGPIVRTPNGQAEYRLGVDNDGNVTATEIT